MELLQTFFNWSVFVDALPLMLRGLGVTVMLGVVSIVLGLVGVAIGAGGVGFAVVGLTRGFVRLLSLPAGRAGSAITGIAVVGYVAKGLGLLTVGVLLVVAAIKVDPDDAGGLDAALDGLIALPLGPLLCGAIGTGLIAYGVFLVLSSRYRRL